MADNLLIIITIQVKQDHLYHIKH